MSTDRLLTERPTIPHRVNSGEVKNKTVKKLITNNDYTGVRYSINTRTRVIKFEGSGINLSFTLGVNKNIPESINILTAAELSMFLSHLDYPDNVISSFILLNMLGEYKRGVFSMDKELKKYETLLVYDEGSDEFKIIMKSFIIRKIKACRTGYSIEDFLMTYYKIRSHMWFDFITINPTKLEKASEEMKVFKGMSSVVN